MKFKNGDIVYTKGHCEYDFNRSYKFMISNDSHFYTDSYYLATYIDERYDALDVLGLLRGPSDIEEEDITLNWTFFEQELIPQDLVESKLYQLFYMTNTRGPINK